MHPEASMTGPALQDTGVTADSFEALADIAIREIGTRRKLHVVCGPITSGGTGLQEYNFDVFNASIRGIRRLGCDVFDQTPYEFGLRRLAWKWEQDGNAGYCSPILEVFYARIFETKAFSDAWFIPGWANSYGASWEMRKLLALATCVHRLSHLEIRGFLHGAAHPHHRVDRIMRLLPRA